MLTERRVETINDIPLEAVARILANHGQIYKNVAPVYQTAMLNDLHTLWDPNHQQMLDIGGGTGVIAEAIKQLFGIRSVVSIDIADRFKEGLTIETGVFDGVCLPYPDNSFDCVMLCNVLHHVPVSSRVPLLKECGRVGGLGPLYIKDHISASALDRLILRIEDIIGNAPYGGQIAASYLTQDDWETLASEAGFRIDGWTRSEYRPGIFKVLFPSRLEIAMRWCR